MAPVAMQGAEHNVEPSHRCHEGCTHQMASADTYPQCLPITSRTKVLWWLEKQYRAHVTIHSKQVYLQPWLTHSLLLNYGWHLAPS